VPWPKVALKPNAKLPPRCRPRSKVGFAAMHDQKENNCISGSCPCLCEMSGCTTRLDCHCESETLESSNAKQWKFKSGIKIGLNPFERSLVPVGMCRVC